MSRLSPGTWANEASLPPLPIPDLQQTLDRYVEWSSPILTAEERDRVADAVDEFRSTGIGERLQQSLLQWKRHVGGNWLEPLWDDMYLGDRGTHIINVSYAFAMNSIEGPLSKGTPAQITAVLIDKLLDFKAKIDDGTYPANELRGTPLAMDQFRKLFNACRVPYRGRDAGVYHWSAYAGPAERPRHVLVCIRGRFFCLDVFDDSETPARVSVDAIASALQYLVDTVGETPPDHECLGFMCAGGRESAARVREVLLDAGAGPLLREVETAIASFTIDMSAAPESDGDLIWQCTTGDQRHRFSDKPVNVIVFGNNRVGFQHEHSGMDGHTTSQLVAAMWAGAQKISDLPRVSSDLSACASMPRALDFPTSDRRLRPLLLACKSDNDDIVAGTAFEYVTVPVGANAIKSLSISPDGFIQAMFHLAYHRLGRAAEGALGQCYESSLAKRFVHGRTETLRTASAAVLSFCRAADGADRSAAFPLLHAAAAEHGARNAACMNGNGIDRHLLGLKTMFERHGAELGIQFKPRLFYDGVYAKYKSDMLSTSTLALPGSCAFAFGPTAPGGFGIGYAVMPSQCFFAITSATPDAPDMRRFVAELKEAIAQFAVPDLQAAAPPRKQASKL